MAVQVAFLYVLKSHESFTYVSPDVFSNSFKSLIINISQDIVRVSFFRSKRLAAMRGVFVCGPAGLPCSARVQVSLVQENIGRTVLPCTSLVDLINYPPDSERLEQKTPTRDAFWCTSETCTSRHRPGRTDSPRRPRNCANPEGGSV